MNKLIATGTIKETDTLKAVASVYADFDEEGKEVMDMGSHYVVMSYKDFDADIQPADSVTFNDIVEKINDESGDESGEIKTGLVVPGVEGHDAVELEYPLAVRYSKTKSFMRNDGVIQVQAAIRYVY